MRALRRRSRKQRLVGVANVEVVDDRNALRQAIAVDLEHWDHPLRIDRSIFVRILLSGEQVHRSAFVIDLLEVEGDANSIRGGRAPIFIEYGAGHVGWLTLVK